MLTVMKYANYREKFFETLNIQLTRCTFIMYYNLLECTHSSLICCIISKKSYKKLKISVFD